MVAVARGFPVGQLHGLAVDKLGAEEGLDAVGDCVMGVENVVHALAGQPWRGKLGTIPLVRSPPHPTQPKFEKFGFYTYPLGFSP